MKNESLALKFDQYFEADSQHKTRVIRGRPWNKEIVWISENTLGPTQFG